MGSHLTPPKSTLPVFFLVTLRVDLSWWKIPFPSKFVGYRLSPNALNIIVKRYSTNNRITFDDFVACCVRLRALTGTVLRQTNLSVCSHRLLTSFRLNILLCLTTAGVHALQWFHFERNFKIFPLKWKSDLASSFARKCVVKFMAFYRLVSRQNRYIYIYIYIYIYLYLFIYIYILHFRATGAGATSFTLLPSRMTCA